MKALLAVMVALIGAVALAQQPEPIAYPAKGQSASQQDKDQDECVQWSRKKSGYDPAKAASAPSAAVQASTTSTPAFPPRPPASPGFPALPRLPGPPDPSASATPDAAGQNFEQTQRELQQRGMREGQHASYARGLAACMEARGYVVK